MLALLGFIVALAMFFHVKRHLGRRAPRRRAAGAARAAGDARVPAPDWQHAWAEKFQRKLEREQRRWERSTSRRITCTRSFERKLDRERRRWQDLADRAERDYGVRIPVVPVQIAAAAAATAMEVAAKARRCGHRAGAPEPRSASTPT